VVELAAKAGFGAVACGGLGATGATACSAFGYVDLILDLARTDTGPATPSPAMQPLQPIFQVRHFGACLNTRIKSPGWSLLRTPSL
jgi:hypothetical protein